MTPQGQNGDSLHNAFCFPDASLSQRDKVKLRAGAQGPGSHRVGQELGVEPEAPHNSDPKVQTEFESTVTLCSSH